MLPKSDKPPENPFSYRPIALLHVIGKILQRIITNAPPILLCKYSLISAHQFGFHSLNSFQQTAALSMDTKKPYDKVRIEALNQIRPHYTILPNRQNLLSIDQG